MLEEDSWPQGQTSHFVTNILHSSILYLFVFIQFYSRPRPGNVVLFQPPVRAPTSSGVDIGMIISIWKGVKQPKLHASGTPVESVSAFRVLVLGMQDPDQVPARDWKCNDRSMAYVCRLESLVSTLDCESSALVFVGSLFCHIDFSWMYVYIHFRLESLRYIVP